MRKIDILANEKFNGDTFKAIEALIINKDPDFGSYINEFTKKRRLILLDVSTLIMLTKSSKKNLARKKILLMLPCMK